MSTALDQTLQAIKPLDYSPEPQIQAELDNLTKPQGSLGGLEELAKKYVLIRVKGYVIKFLVLVLAGDQGFVADGVCDFPP